MEDVEHAGQSRTGTHSEGIQNMFSLVFKNFKAFFLSQPRMF